MSTQQQHIVPVQDRPHQTRSSAKAHGSNASTSSFGVARLPLKRKESSQSDSNTAQAINRRREAKLNTRKASHFTKAQKIQEGVLSEDDIQSPTNPSAINHESHNPVVFDPIEAEAENFFSEDMLFPFNDENFVLDTTQDLPIRKPQSAYVIFGKLVS